MDPVINTVDKEPVKDLLKEYLDQMGPFDRVVLEVAKRQLGMSFDMKRSIGFLEFMKEKEKEKTSVKC
jgi:hypothetical protein